MKNYRFPRPGAASLASKGQPEPQAFGDNRALFDFLKKQYPSNSCIITESYLRSESVLGNQNTISFPILNNVGTPRAQEKRLSSADRFIVSSIGFAIQRISTLPNESARSPLHYFPNPNIFAEHDEIYKIYNGFASFKIGAVTYYDSLDMLQFLNVGVAQQNVILSTAAAGDTRQYGHDSKGGVDTGFKKIVPTMDISGLDKTTFDITLPEPGAMGAAAANQANVAVLLMRGFLVQNGANFRPAFG